MSEEKQDDITELLTLAHQMGYEEGKASQQGVLNALQSRVEAAERASGAIDGVLAAFKLIIVPEATAEVRAAMAIRIAKDYEAKVSALQSERDELRDVLDYLSIEPDELGRLWTNMLGRYAFPHEIAKAALASLNSKEPADTRLCLVGPSAPRPQCFLKDDNCDYPACIKESASE